MIRVFLKRQFSFLVFVILLLVLGGCNKSSSSSQSSTSLSQSSSTSDTSSSSSRVIPSSPLSGSGTNKYGLANDIQDGNILHAWNWSMNTIKSHMSDIAEAGYSTIQTSPMQPQKDYVGEGTWNNHWWKLYQPLGFSIATKNNAIGTKDELIAMCAEAQKYGIKVIVDVVANHLAGTSYTEFHSSVKEYEPEIYEQKLRHVVGPTSDASTQFTVRGYLGSYPDLMTESPIVQRRVLDLLKEYLDCGVSGFRFDAAKHIETPSDGEYASDFWPVVINGSKAYAKTLGIDEPYYYGEILNTVGGGRSYDYYTPFMSITDNKTGNSIRQGVVNSNATTACSKAYKTGCPANKTVLWAESHDTYANDSKESTNVFNTALNKAYAIVSSRNDAASLFFARPNKGTVLGSIGENNWQSIEVSSINKFHNYFIGYPDESKEVDGLFISTRLTTNKDGAIIVNVSGSNSLKGVAIDMKDGKYLDQISGTEFVVNDGTITGEIGSSGIAVVYNAEVVAKPVISVSNTEIGFFFDSLELTISVQNATTASYKIGDATAVEFTDSVKIKLGENSQPGLIKLVITAANASKSIEKSYDYYKRDDSNLTITVNNLNYKYVDGKDIYAWVWQSGKDGRWIKGTYDDYTYTFEFTKTDTHFLLAAFGRGVTPNWTEKPYQSMDVAIGIESIYDGTDYVWKKAL